MECLLNWVVRVWSHVLRISRWSWRVLSKDGMSSRRKSNFWLLTDAFNFKMYRIAKLSLSSVFLNKTVQHFRFPFRFRFRFSRDKSVIFLFILQVKKTTTNKSLKCIMWFSMNFLITHKLYIDVSCVLFGLIRLSQIEMNNPLVVFSSAERIKVA